jgi:hypothetical protein
MKPQDATCANPRPRASWLTKRQSVIHNPFGGKSAVILVSAVVAASACGHSGTTAKSSTARVSSVGELIVSIEDVRRIASTEDLTPHVHADLHQPPPADANAPGPCGAVGHSDATFGNRWSEFRSAGYNGVTDDITPGTPDIINEVSQAIARYPNSDTASGAFQQLGSKLQACVDLHNANFSFTLDKPDPSTLRISDVEWSHLYRQKSDVLISVGVVGLQAADQIANTLVQMIGDRIK